MFIKEGQLKQFNLLLTSVLILTIIVFATSETLNSTNNPPTLRVNDVTVSVGEWALVLVHAEDPEGDELTQTFFPPLDQLGTWKPTEADIGGHIFSVLVTDGHNIVSEEFTIVVLPENIPEIIPDNVNPPDISEPTPDINEIPTKPKKKLKDIAELHKKKLNNKTKGYLQELEDEDEERDYIIKYSPSFDKSKITKYDREYSKFKVAKIHYKAVDIQELLEDSEILYIELDQNIETLADIVPYGVNKTKANSIWNVTNGTGVKIAILDTGAATHDDLEVADGKSVVSDNYTDTYGHGTLVTGVVAALLNNKGLVGIAPDADIYAVKIANGSTGQLSDAIEGVEWTINNSMDIISMSFGMESYSQIFKEVIADAYDDNDILLIAAAGNNGQNNVLYPAAYSDVIAVGAVNKENSRASFSSYGFELELVAAGVNVNSTYLNNSYNISSGTSFAAPHVTGVAALIKSYNKSLTNVQIRGKLRNDALDLGASGKDDYYGYGLVQVNLDSSNFTLQNDSYFYEVLNISNYDTDYEARTFWLNGTGTIDDVNFNEGYYLILKHFDRIFKQVLNVSENGSIYVLASLVFTDDDYVFYGDLHDAKVWKNGSVDFDCSDCGSKQVSCYTYDGTEDYPVNFEFSECWAKSSSDLSLCRAPDSDLDDFCTNNASLCHSTGINDQHSYPSNLLKNRDRQWLGFKAWYDCGDASYEYDSDYDRIYIIDALKATCGVTNATWIAYGRNDTNSWVFLETLTCGGNTQCDPERDDVIVANNKSYMFENTVNDVCRTKDGFSCSEDDDCLTGHYCVSGICSATEGELCNGTLNIATSDNDLNVRVNNNHEGDTDESQFIQKTISNVCGTELSVTVLCSDNTTTCHSESTYLSTDGDTVTVVDSNCVKTCDSNQNFWLTNEDVSVKGDKINITIRSSNLNGTVNISLHRINKETGLIDDTKSLLPTISKYSTVSVNTTWDLTSASALNIYIDKEGKFDENKNDNFVYRIVSQNVPKTYLSINTSYPLIDSLIESYLEQYVDSVPENDADLIISVGRFTSEFESNNPETLKSNPLIWWKKQGWGYEEFGTGGRITAYGKPDASGYAGIVGRTEYNNKPLVLAYGVDIDGDIATVKKLVSARDLFFEDFDNPEKPPVIMDSFDRLALGVNNLLPRNVRRESSAYLLVVNKILFDNAFDVAIRTVKTLDSTSYGENTTLRIKNVNADYSDDFKDTISNSDKPVVFSGGIFSDLETWEGEKTVATRGGLIAKFRTGLAKELADEGRDVWEIELTGGPTIDSDCQPEGTYNCPNYLYSDLVDYYWPASIAGVQAYTDTASIDYVGHSNGCRVALSSLNSYSSGKSNAGYFFNLTNGQYQLTDLESNPVDILVGIACPVTLNDETRFTEAAREPRFIGGQPRGDFAIETLNTSQKFHVTNGDFAKLTNPIRGKIADIFFLENFKISLNLMDFYNDLAIEENSGSSFSNVNISKLFLIFGVKDYLDVISNGENDGVVDKNDATIILNNITTSEESLELFKETHSGLSESSAVKKYIRGKLQ